MDLIGQEAFECGLLIGYHDFRLVTHPTKDVLIMYPHRTMEEFLGAFSFVRMLDTGGATIEEMSEPNIDDSVVVTNYTFLHCVIWFLSLCSVKKYFALENRVAIEMNLKKSLFQA